MKKIPTLFVRNADGQIINEVHSDCAWVVDGEGTATRKYDGTSCLVRDGVLFKRQEIKTGAAAPPSFEPVGEDSGKTQGWVPVGDGPDDKWHREAMTPDLMDGTYELIGPKVQGNPEKEPTRVLVPHGAMPLNAPRTYDGLREYFETADVEGIVWWHRDGRMAKIKAKDFGIKRGKP